MARSRTKRVALTVGTSLLSEGVALVCGLVLPKMILSNFGSAYNAISQSISQFISYISLMKAGIGGATAVALYKPLAEKDTKEISEVLASTEKFMRKISYIFLIFVCALSIFYPLVLVRDYDWFFLPDSFECRSKGLYYSHFGYPDDDPEYDRSGHPDEAEYVFACREAGKLAGQPDHADLSLCILP